MHIHVFMLRKNLMVISIKIKVKLAKDLYCTCSTQK